MYRHFFKRILDILISGIGLLVLAIPMGIIAILVRKNLGAPVIFSQKRPGRIDPKTGKEKIFTLYKFRSMRDAIDPKTGEQLPDEERMTPFGEKLRSTSLDELPELWNIFKGNMSIIGPRPLLVEYLDRYSEEQRHRHDVRPGLTGLAQINGRNAISWEDKFRYDVEYTRNISLGLDLKIFFGTIKVVLGHEGISSETSVTMEEFKGNGKE